MEFANPTSVIDQRDWESLTEKELKSNTIERRTPYKSLDTVPLKANKSVREWGSLTEEELKKTQRNSFNPLTVENSGVGAPPPGRKMWRSSSISGPAPSGPPVNRKQMLPQSHPHRIDHLDSKQRSRPTISDRFSDGGEPSSYRHQKPLSIHYISDTRSDNIASMGGYNMPSDRRSDAPLGYVRNQGSSNRYHLPTADISHLDNADQRGYHRYSPEPPNRYSLNSNSFGRPIQMTHQSNLRPVYGPPPNLNYYNYSPPSRHGAPPNRYSINPYPANTDVSFNNTVRYNEHPANQLPDQRVFSKPVTLKAEPPSVTNPSSPIPIKSPKTIPTSPFQLPTAFSWESQSEAKEQLFDMKKFILSRENDMVETISPQKTLERQRKLSFEKMNQISKHPETLKFLNQHLILKQPLPEETELTDENDQFSVDVAAKISIELTLADSSPLESVEIENIDEKPIESNTSADDSSAKSSTNENSLLPLATSKEAKRLSFPTPNSKKESVEMGFLSLTWKKPSLPDNDIFGLENSPWMLKDETELNEAIGSSVIRKKSVRSKSYRESHLAISASSELDNSALDSIVEMQDPTFVKASLKLDEIENVQEESDSSDSEDDESTQSSAEDVNGNTIETLDDEIDIRGKSVASDIFDPVLPESKIPEIVFAPDIKSTRKSVPKIDELDKSDSIGDIKNLPAETFARNEKSSSGTSSDFLNPIRGPLAWFKNLMKRDKSHKKDIEYPEEIIPSNRLALAQERAVYALSHLKLSESHRPMHQQILISNLMLYILSVHSDVTIHGRGPRPLKRKKGQRKKPFKNILGTRSSPSQNNSTLNEDKLIRKAPLIKFDDDEDDDVPLAILKSKT